MTTIEIDTSGLRQVIEDLGDALGRSGKPGDASEIVRDETRRLVAEMVKNTPPKKQKLGADKLNKDLKRLFSGASSGLLTAVYSARKLRKHQAGLVNVDEWITTAAGSKLHLLWGRVDVKGAGMKAFHRANLNKRTYGTRAAKGEWRARYVVQDTALKRYITQTNKKVGRMKASLAVTAKNLGEQNITSWISRHFVGNSTPTAISITAGLMNGEKPSVTFGSRAPGIGKLRGIFQTSVRARSEAVKKRVALIVSGYSRDMARRMRIQSRAARSGQGGRYAIG